MRNKGSRRKAMRGKMISAVAKRYKVGAIDAAEFVDDTVKNWHFYGLPNKPDSPAAIIDACIYFELLADKK